MKLILATLAVALFLSTVYNVEAYNYHPLVQQACFGVPFEDDCVASISSKLSSKPDAEIKYNEILDAAITVLKERAIQASDGYSNEHENSSDSDYKSALMAALGEYNKVVAACEKASGPAKAGVFAVAKTAVDEADQSVSSAEAYDIENPNLKHLNLNLKMASNNAVVIAIKALGNPTAQGEN